MTRRETVKKALRERGYSEERIHNNRGLIGAVIKEMEQVTIKELTSLKQTAEACEMYGDRLTSGSIQLHINYFINETETR